MTTTTFKPAALACAIMVLPLAGCIDSSSNSDGDNQTQAPGDQQDQNTDTTTISGVAAEGAPLVEASIEAVCDGGDGFIDPVVTDENGRFSGEVSADSLPCKLRASGQSDDETASATDFRGMLYSLIMNPDQRVNITPFTDMTTQAAISKTLTTWFDTDNVNMTETKRQEAIERINRLLGQQGYSINLEEDPYSVEFEIGDRYDRQMDDYALAIGNDPNISDHNAVRDMIADGNLGEGSPAIPESPNQSDESDDQPTDSPSTDDDFDSDNPTQPSQQMLEEFPIDYQTSKEAWNDFFRLYSDDLQDTTRYTHIADSSEDTVWINDRLAFAWPILSHLSFYDDSFLPADIEAFPTEPFPGFVNLNMRQNVEENNVVIDIAADGTSDIGGLKYLSADEFHFDGTITKTWDMTHFHVDDLSIKGDHLTDIDTLRDFEGSHLSISFTEVSDISPLSNKEFDTLGLKYLELDSLAPLINVKINDEISITGMTYSRGDDNPYPDGLPVSAPICNDDRVTIEDTNTRNGRDYLCQ